MFFFRSCSSRWYSNSSFWFFLFSLVLFLLEVSLHYIVLHCSILSSTCLPSSLVFEFLFLPSQLFDFLGVKVIENTVQRSSPHKCSQESCCNAFNAMVAAFSQDISASLSLPCTFVIYLHLWNFLEGGLRGRRGPSHRHMPDLRRVFLSDQYPWTLTCFTVSYGVSLWFPLLGRIVDKMWYLSPLQGPKFLLPHNSPSKFWFFSLIRGEKLGFWCISIITM